MPQMFLSIEIILEHSRSLSIERSNDRECSKVLICLKAILLSDQVPNNLDGLVSVVFVLFAELLDPKEACVTDVGVNYTMN
jgi:hypothetical protein